MTPAERLVSDFRLTPVIATEIEFYLHGISKTHSPDDVPGLIGDACTHGGIKLAAAERERGPDQYEVSFLPSSDIAAVIAETQAFQRLMQEIFAADFAAKPQADAPGSGLHIHLHLENAAGQNVFTREGEAYSMPLLHTVGGLLALMNPCMPVFAPTAASYARIIAAPNAYLLCPTAANVPLTVSWGANNRTVAIRLPNKPMNRKHIEHRVSGSDADIARVIAAVLAGAHYGLKHRCDPGPPIYGDASLAQYALPKLARSLPQAQGYWNGCKALKDYFR